MQCSFKKEYLYFAFNMKYILQILFCLFFFQGISQNYADKDYYLVDSLEIDKVSDSDKKLLDSCLTIFHQAKDDTTRLKPIARIIEESWDDRVWPKYNQWVYHFTQEKLKENPNEKIKYKLSKRLASSLNNIGYYNSTKGNISEALKFYEKGLKLQRELGEKKDAANSLNNIGTIYKKQGDIPNALEYYHESLKIFTELDASSGIGQALNNIGNIYQEQGDPNLALEYFHRSKSLYKKLGNERALATILNNIGFTYFKKKNIPKALDYYEQSIAIRKKLEDHRGMANCFNNIASAHEHVLNHEKAMEFYLKSNKIYNEIGSKLGLSTSSVNIGRVLYHQGKVSEAKKYISTGLELAKKAGSPRNILGAAKLLSQIYEDKGKGMKALEMHKLYITMHDSVENERNQKAVIQQNAKYQYQKEKAIDDAERDNLIAIQEKEKEKQTIISIATAFVLILVLIFSFFVITRLKITRKQKVLIEVQNKEIVDSITYAKRIQEAILPSTELFNKTFPSNFIYYKPKDIVAGDFYWLELAPVIKEPLIFFAVADCTGHGVPGAMVSVVCNNALNSSVREHKLTDPGQILDKTREIVVEQFNKSQTTSISNIRDGMDIALCVLNTKTNVIKFAGAYNPLWIIRNGSETIEELKATRQAIGKVDNPQQFKTSETALNKGDQIYLFSDGFADQFGGSKGKKMMNRGFKELLVSNRTASLENQKQQLHTHFETWRNDLEQIDDVCVIGVKI